MKEINYKFKNKNIIVSIREDEDTYFYAMKDCAELYLALRIKVYENNDGVKGNYLCSYYREWDTKISQNHINAFIKKFLENPKYREDFLVDGNNFMDIISTTDDTGINKKCSEAIKRFYKIKAKNRKFKDYANLKTYGMDKFSRFKLDKLTDLIDDKIVDYVKTVFSEEKDISSTLKWYLRGLQIDDAIRKVKTDLEIANNIK